MNSLAAVRRMTPEELARLDAQIKEAERLIGNRRKIQQQIDFEDRRSAERRSPAKKLKDPE